jgi:hypothetical protein
MSSSSSIFATATAGTTSSSSTTPPSSQFAAWRESTEVTRAKMAWRTLYQERLNNRLKKNHQSSNHRVEFVKQDERRLYNNRLDKKTDELHKKKK